MQKRTLFPLLFLIGTLILALFGYNSWRNDQRLARDGQEAGANLVERSIRPHEICDTNDECREEDGHFLAYSFTVDDTTYQKEQLVTADIYNRAESTLPIVYLPENPNVSNLIANVESTSSLPVFAIVAVLVGIVGTAVIFLMQR